MTTASRHHIVTVPRQEGYAARCEYEVGGEVQLCNITFGNFPTRTAARQACAKGRSEAASR
jgi:hypothetical protein